MTSVEKTVQQALFYRRLGAVVVVAVLLLAFAVALFFWTRYRLHSEQINRVTYDNLDESAPTYWTDRVEQDIAAVKRLELPPQQELSRLRSQLQRTLLATAAISQGFDRCNAISDISLTVFRHDVALNVDEFLETMGETPLALAMRARILVSNALMQLRLKDQVAAAVSMNNYDRIVNQSDVKLDTEPAELAFCGAVKVFRYTFDTAALDALFQKNLKFNTRITDSGLQMKANRIVAVEQARSGKDRDAMETASQINNPTELVRAFQGIIINVARPSKPELSEPTVFLPQSEGPWIPLSDMKNTKRVINDVLNLIASRETIGDQVDLLMRLAGSRMVCDPDLHSLFKSCLLDSRKIDEIAKRPVLQLLQDPESELIRQSLHLPPSTKKKSTDPALDNWASTTDEISVDISGVDSSVMTDVVNIERIRLQLAIARSYLAVNRRADAALGLQQCCKVAQTLTNIRERIDFLLDVAELQINAGDHMGVRATFKMIGLPKLVEGVVSWQILAPDAPVPTEPKQDSMELELARLTRLKILARFLDDAELTLGLIPTGDMKDEESYYLALELIRLQRLREATRVLVGMTDSPRTKEMFHRLGIAKGGTEDDYLALNLAFPEKTQKDDALVDTAYTLIQFGLDEAAVKTAKQISEAERRVALLLRIVRNMMTFFGAYGDSDPDHAAIRKMLLERVFRIVGEIEPLRERAEALELVLSAAIPLAKEKDELELLQPVAQQALEIAKKIPPTELTRPGIVAKLLFDVILLHAAVNNRPTTRWPILNREFDRALIDEIREQISEVAVALNDTEDELYRARGMVVAARVFGGIGRTQNARQIVDAVLEIAKQESDKRAGVSLFLSTVPLLRLLGDLEAAKTVYYDAFVVVGNVPDADPTGGNAGMIFGSRLRDSEIDRLVRSLLENDFVAEAIFFANRITDDTIRDRLLRIVVFRFIDKEDFAEAESTARRFSDSDAKTYLLRCVAFAKRQLGKNVSP